MKVELREALSGVWIATRTEPSGWCFNTILVLEAGALVVYSPTRNLGDELHEQIRSIGAPRALVAANHFHHLGLEEWRLRYPEASVFARSQAIPRLTKKYRGIPFEPIEKMPAQDLARIEPNGTKNGEVWLRTNGAWIVGDAFSNLRGPISGVTGFLLDLINVRPGLAISRIWAPLHLDDRAAYRTWLLDELARDPPSWLIPAHGDPISSPDLPERMRALALRALA